MAYVINVAIRAADCIKDCRSDYKLDNTRTDYTEIDIIGVVEEERSHDITDIRVLIFITLCIGLAQGFRYARVQHDLVRNRRGHTVIRLYNNR